jgi:hypothetical protein
MQPGVTTSVFNSSKNLAINSGSKLFASLTAPLYSSKLQGIAKQRSQFGLPQSEFKRATDLRNRQLVKQMEQREYSQQEANRPFGNRSIGTDPFRLNAFRKSGFEESPSRSLRQHTYSLRERRKISSSQLSSSGATQK